MKNKTIFKVLPALLITPILACCITLYANASETDKHTLYDLISNPVEQFFNINIFDNSEQLPAFSEANEDFEYYDDDSGNWSFRIATEEVLGTTEDVAYIGYRYSYETLSEIVVPIKVYLNNVPYKVVGIDGNALAAQIPKARKTVQTIIINGYERNETTNQIEGGWFKSLASTACAYYYGSESEGIYSGGALSKVVLPDCLKSIGPSAFMNDSALKNIYSQKVNGNTIEENVGFPSQLTRIGNKAFMDCSALDFSDNQNTMIIPDKVSLLEAISFKHCYALKNVVINSPLLKSIDGADSDSDPSKAGGAFEDCTNLVNINLDNASSLQSFGVYAFKGCTSLPHIKLPASVTNLNKQSFANCSSLNNIELNEGLTTIGPYCFAKLTQETATASTLEYIFIPESVINIDEGAFQNNKELREVVIGMEDAYNSNIGFYAFSNCPQMISMTFLWNTPRLLQTGFINDQNSTSILSPTPAIDVRFRPLISSSEFGGREKNYWLEIVDDSKYLSSMIPKKSRLMLIAAFDNDKYGNDLQKYLSESTGMFDDATFETKNGSLKNEVLYEVCITIPDVLKLRNTGTLKTYAKTAGSNGRSKGIQFIYDETNIHQITHDGKEINRPADDGVLIINNNAIQVNSNNILNVKYQSKAGTKSNPCIYGHGIGASNNPFQNTYDYLTADVTQMDRLRQSESSVNNPVICNNNPEDEIVDEDKPLLLTFGRGEDDVTIHNACCFFTKPGGEDSEGKMLNDAILTITNVTFGGKWTDNSVPDKDRKTVDVGNNCQLGCVYNDGKLTMSGCNFQNSVGTWSGTTSKGDSYGGSCLFNYRTATLSGCIMENCSASYDGGAIMNADSLSITNCTINKCTAGHFGGAIFNNVGDSGRGGSGSSGLIVKACTLTNNSAGTGGAIYYCNGSTLDLSGSLTFSGNTDEDGTCDVFIGTKMKLAAIAPITLGDGFGCEGKITLAVQKAKNKLVVVSGGASAISSFAYQNEKYELEASGSDIALKTATTEFTLATDGNGTWVNEDGEEVESFTIAGTTAPDPGQTITYTDVDGQTHTLTATAKANYEFAECTLSGTTYTATFTEVTPTKQKIINLTKKLKESINNRNADSKEALKTEIYGK